MRTHRCWLCREIKWYYGACGCGDPGLCHDCMRNLSSIVTKDHYRDLPGHNYWTCAVLWDHKVAESLMVLSGLQA